MSADWTKYPPLPEPPAFPECRGKPDSDRINAVAASMADRQDQHDRRNDDAPVDFFIHFPASFPGQNASACLSMNIFSFALR